MKTSPEQAARDNRAIQLNPEHPTFYRARGFEPKVAEHAALGVRGHHPRSAPPLESSQARSSSPAGARTPR